MKKKFGVDIGMEEIRKGMRGVIREGKKKEAEARKKREKRLLIFKVSRDFLNVLWDRFKEGYNKITPTDSTIYRIGEIQDGYQTYYFILASEKFPIMVEGAMIPEGTIDYDSDHHNIIFKIKE